MGADPKVEKFSTDADGSVRKRVDVIVYCTGFYKVTVSVLMDLDFISAPRDKDLHFRRVFPKGRKIAILLLIGPAANRWAPSIAAWPNINAMVASYFDKAGKNTRFAVLCLRCWADHHRSFFFFEGEK